MSGQRQPVSESLIFLGEVWASLAVLRGQDAVLGGQIMAVCMLAKYRTPCITSRI